MKVFMMSALLIVSSLAFGQGMSDFERGFREGRKACGHEEFWYCRNPELVFGSGDQEKRMEAGQFTARGFSRADALSKLPAYVVDKVVEQEVSFDCRKL